MPLIGLFLSLIYLQTSPLSIGLIYGGHYIQSQEFKRAGELHRALEKLFDHTIKDPSLQKEVLKSNPELRDTFQTYMNQKENQKTR